MTIRREDVAFLGAGALATLVREKRLSPVELVEVYLRRIDALDGRLRAFITVCGEDALRAAREAEVAVARGEAPGPLHGVPVAVKDQFYTNGIRTTVGSRILEKFIPEEDATVVARLKSAGAILLGKLNLSEFAFGGTLHHPFGQPRNPWHLECDPGGSSSGSAVATAAALCAATLGEDTGGSVRGPASWCGTVGVRPAWGRVSRHGCYPLSWSMDTAGPLTRTVEDSALLLKVIAGYDPKDPLTSRRSVPDYPAALTGEVRGLRVGIIRELTLGADTDPEVGNAVSAAGTLLGRLGARVEELSLPLLPLAGAVFMALADSEGAGLHQHRLLSRPDDYDHGTRRRLFTASLLPAAVYHQAQRARGLIREQVLDALARYDLLLCPTSPRSAPPIAAGGSPITSKEEAARRFFTRRSYTTPFSLAGTPAMSIPCGFTTSGLPIGLQLAGRPFDEATLFRVSYAYEQETAWHTRRPSL
ncbi:MAG: amidase [Candidatus Methylomirabilia bacterium]